MRSCSKPIISGSGLSFCQDSATCSSLCTYEYQPLLLRTGDQILVSRSQPLPSLALGGAGYMRLIKQPLVCRWDQGPIETHVMDHGRRPTSAILHTRNWQPIPHLSLLGWYMVHCIMCFWSSWIFTHHLVSRSQPHPSLLYGRVWYTCHTTSVRALERR